MPEWFEGLDAEHQVELEAKGWKAPLTPEIAAALAQAHRAATKLIGAPADQVLRLPKDATDPTYQSVYERIAAMAMPGADGYKFDGIAFKDGAPLSADDTKFVSDLAAKFKLPAPVARGIASELAARADAFEASDVERNNLGRQANDTALTSAWGSEASQKKFAASQAADALAALGLKVPDGAGMDPQAYVAHMTGLVALAGQLNEAAIVRGGRTPADPTTGMTSQTARARFDELKQSQEWVSKALTPGTAEATLFAQLQAAMVQAPR